MKYFMGFVDVIKNKGCYPIAGGKKVKRKK
jgi:hypothetical protein